MLCYSNKIDELFRKFDNESTNDKIFPATNNSDVLT